MCRDYASGAPGGRLRGRRGWREPLEGAPVLANVHHAPPFAMTASSRYRSSMDAGRNGARRQPR